LRLSFEDDICGPVKILFEHTAPPAFQTKGLVGSSKFKELAQFDRSDVSIIILVAVSAADHLKA
jgi:hypothetical protein